MNAEQVLRALTSMGTAPIRAMYTRLGVAGPVAGVAYAEQRRLGKRIGVDHDLAIALWATGHHEARLLATMIADPDAVTVGLLNAWQQDLDNYILADALAGLVFRTSGALARMRQWTGSTDEWVARCGWSLAARLAMKDPTLADELFASLIESLERDFHQAPDRARDAMSSALIAMAMRNDRLKQRVVECSRRLRRAGRAADPPRQPAADIAPSPGGENPGNPV